MYKKPILFVFLLLFFSNISAQVTNFNLLDDFLAPLNNPATIEGRVYLDINGNGVQDPNEPGLEDISIIIINANNVGFSTLTDSNGDWSFDVMPGTTIVFVSNNSLPVGAVLTQGEDPSTFMAIEDEVTQVTHFGYFITGSIEGRVYLDVNGNGQQDSGEPGIEDVDISLTDEFGNETIVFTNQDGDWSAEDIGTGEVVIDINQDAATFPTGAVQTEGTDPKTVNLQPGENLNVGNDGFFDFGTLEGIVYLDENGNGTQDPGEPGIANINIDITTPDGSPLTTTTDADGNWSIDVPTGNNVVEIDESQPNFPALVVQTEGTNPTTQTVNTNEIIFQIDGFAEAGLLDGVIYLDENANGTQDPGEPGIAGVDIEITDLNGDVQIVNSDANGNWEVLVLAGEVTSLIDEDHPNFPTNAVQTEGTNPTTSIVIAGETLSEVDGFFVLEEDTGQLTGNVYEDINGNGTQDPGEEGIPNVEVIVTDSNGNSQSVTTNQNGLFSAIVPEGETNYLINENDPNFPTGAIQTEGTNPTQIFVDADTTTFGGNNGYFIPDEDVVGQLFAHLYFDLNGNGTQDPDEPDMPNVEVLITDTFGNQQTVETDANGDFFVEVPAGINVYEINENDPDFPTGAIQTEGTNPTEVFVASGSDTFGGNNGFFEPDEGLTGLLFAHLYFDLNGNGTQDPGEPDMPDVEVLITDTFGNQQTVETDANGNFSVEVPAGINVYEINEEDSDFPTGAIQTEGTNPTEVFVAVDSNTFGGNNGFFEPDEGLTGLLFAHLYFDVNGNGTQDADEPDMPDVEVLITDTFGNQQTVETDANGNFSVEVPAGINVYEINEEDPDFPTGAIQTEGTNPTEVFVAVDSDTFGGNNGFFVPDENLTGQLFAHLYFDLNGNGTQDANEPDMPNVEVLITDTFGNQQSVDTDANGNFSVEVPAGINVYEINENDPDFPTGALQTEGSNPTEVFVPAGSNTFGGNNGFFDVEDSDEFGGLTGLVYLDENANGNFDEDEEGIPNINIIITNSEGNNQTVTTNANGIFSAVVIEGETSILIDENDPDFPTGAIQTEGTNPINTIVTIGETTEVGDSGYFVPDENIEGILTARVYLDSNGNGTQDNDELGIENIEIIITDVFANEQIVFTDENGDFDAIVPAGPTSYLINEEDIDFPENAIQTEGENPSIDILVVANEITDDGGNGFFVPDEDVIGTLIGKVYFDANNNGELDEDEIGIPNVEIEVTDAFEEILFITTDENGDFEVATTAGLTTIFIDETQENLPEGAILTEGIIPDTRLVTPESTTNFGNFGYFAEIDEEVEDDGLEIFNAVHPNGDGRNDFFRIEGIENFPSNNLKIFNRSGIKVFDVNNYGISGNLFVGISEGRITIQKNKQLPAGTYFYLFEYRDNDGSRKKKQGYLYLK